MSPLRSWQREIHDVDQLAREANPSQTVVVETRETVDDRYRATKAEGHAACTNCGRRATRWIRSTSQFFSAPRCGDCGDALVSRFVAKGVTDVRVDAIGGAQ